MTAGGFASGQNKKPGSLSRALHSNLTLRDATDAVLNATYFVFANRDSNGL